MSPASEILSIVNSISNPQSENSVECEFHSIDCDAIPNPESEVLSIMNSIPSIGNSVLNPESEILSIMNSIQSIMNSALNPKSKSPVDYEFDTIVCGLDLKSRI